MLDAKELLDLLDAADAWRRPGALPTWSTPRSLVRRRPPRRGRALEKALAAARGQRGEIAKEVKTPAEIRDRIDNARLAAIRRVLEES